MSTKGTWEERVGSAAYEEYAKEMRDQRGTFLPPWHALSPELQRIWGRVARATAHKIAEEKQTRAPSSRRRAAAG